MKYPFSICIFCILAYLRRGNNVFQPIRHHRKLSAWLQIHTKGKESQIRKIRHITKPLAIVGFGDKKNSPLSKNVSSQLKNVADYLLLSARVRLFVEGTDTLLWGHFVMWTLCYGDTLLWIYFAKTPEVPLQIFDFE